jgi:lipid-A-disaccharide synthase
VRIFFSTGEASGDMYGSQLLREIRKKRPDLPIQIDAIGGKQLAATGAHLIANSSKWGAIGIFESLKMVPRIMGSYLKARRTLKIGEPGLFIPIDFGFMNIRLARLARQLDWKVLYFMPPGSWRRTTQGESLPEITDEIVTPFSWSAGILNGIGGHSHWYGHPAKQIIFELFEEPVIQDPNRIAVLPGSRKSEVRLNLATIAKAAKAFPAGATIEIALASNVSREEATQIWQRHYKGVIQTIFTGRDTIGVLRRARGAVVCSGTATLEAALCNCPMVVIYKVSRMAELEAKIIRFKPGYISLPNIILNRKVVPELIQKEAKPSIIADHIISIAADGPERDSQLHAFVEISNALGGTDAITRTASLALGMLLG